MGKARSFAYPNIGVARPTMRRMPVMPSHRPTPDPKVKLIQLPPENAKGKKDIYIVKQSVMGQDIPLVGKMPDLSEVIHEGEVGMRSGPIEFPFDVVEQDLTFLQKSEVQDISNSEELSILYVGSSIAHHCDIEEVKKQTGTQIQMERAYGSVYNPLHRFPEKNFTDVVTTQVVTKDILVMQASSVDLTELGRQTHMSQAYVEQKALDSSYNMIKIAESALRDSPYLKQVILNERVPRYDNLKQLSENANKELYQLREASVYKDKIHIGKHTLECEGELRNSRYGYPSEKCYDAIHLRGRTGKKSYTESILNIFSEAGIQVCGKNIDVVKEVVDEKVCSPQIKSKKTLIIEKETNLSEPTTKYNRSKMFKKKTKSEWHIGLENKFQLLDNEEKGKEGKPSPKYEPLLRTPQSSLKVVGVTVFSKSKTVTSLREWHYATSSSNRARKAYTKQELTKGKSRDMKQGLIEAHRKFGLAISNILGSDDFEDIIKLASVLDSFLPITYQWLRGGGPNSRPGMVQAAINSAAGHGIQLVPGRPIPGDGNCAFAAATANVNDRDCFREDCDRYELSVDDYRQVWVTELQDEMNKNHLDLIQNLGTATEREKSWNLLKHSGEWTEPRFSDFMIWSIARGLYKTILIFNTSINAAGPIHVATPERFGGFRDSEIPIILAYNQNHYESLHAKTSDDIDKCKALVNEFLNHTYTKQKKDIPSLIGLHPAHQLRSTSKKDQTETLVINESHENKDPPNKELTKKERDRLRKQKSRANKEVYERESAAKAEKRKDSEFKLRESTAMAEKRTDSEFNLRESAAQAEGRNVFITHHT